MDAERPALICPGGAHRTVDNPRGVENYLGHFLEKLQTNMEQVQTNAPATKGRASRAPFVVFVIVCDLMVLMVVVASDA